MPAVLARGAAEGEAALSVSGIWGTRTGSDRASGGFDIPRLLARFLLFVVCFDSRQDVLGGKTSLYYRHWSKLAGGPRPEVS